MLYFKSEAGGDAEEMVEGAHHTRTVAIVGSSEGHMGRVASLVECSRSGPYEITRVEEPVKLPSVLANEQFDILFIETRARVGALDAISFVKLNTAELKFTQVVYVDGEPSSVPEVYETDHVYLLPRSFSDSQVESALAKARERLRRISERPVMIKTRMGESVVSPHRISYVESDKRQLVIHLVEGTLRTYGKLSDLIDLLPGRFIQCHKSFLVNLGYVAGMGREELVLTTGEQVPVSQKRRRVTREALSSYVGKRSL